MSSQEVQDAVGEATARTTKAQDVIKTEPSLEQQAAGLRRIIAEPSDKERAAADLARIERRIADARETRAREEAEKRLLDIRRAYGSAATNVHADEKRVREKVAELSEAIARLNDRYAQVCGYKAEAAALCDRFGMPAPALPNVVAPALREIDLTPTVELLRPNHISPKRERCEHGLRERRNYEEVRGTEAFRIIEASGLKAWPDLTERQQQLVEARARQEEDNRRQLSTMSQGVANTIRALSAVPGGGTGGL